MPRLVKRSARLGSNWCVFDAVGRFIVENIGGGGGSLGGAATARARPDGYTILVAGTSQYVIEALVKNRPQFDPIKDLEPIANAATYTFAIDAGPENLHARLAARDTLCASAASGIGSIITTVLSCGTKHWPGALRTALVA